MKITVDATIPTHGKKCLYHHQSTPGYKSLIMMNIFFICQAAESGGVVVVVGLGKPEIKMPVIDFLVREVDVRGIFRYVNW